MIATAAPAPASTEPKPAAQPEAGFSETASAIVAQNVQPAPSDQVAVTAQAGRATRPADTAPAPTSIAPANGIARPGLVRDEGTFTADQSYELINVKVGEVVSDIGQYGIGLAVAKLKLGPAPAKSREIVTDVLENVQKIPGIGNHFSTIVDGIHVEMNVANTSDRSQDVLHVKLRKEALEKLPPKIREATIFALASATARLSADPAKDPAGYSAAVLANEAYYRSMYALPFTSDVGLTVSPGAKDLQPRARAYHAFSTEIPLGDLGQKIADRLDKSGLGAFQAKPQATLWASSRMYFDPKDERANFQLLIGGEVSLDFDKGSVGFLNNPINLKAYAPGTQGYARDGDTFGAVLMHEGEERFLPLPEMNGLLTSVPSFEIPALDRPIPRISADEIALDLIGGEIDTEKVEELIEQARPYAQGLDYLRTLGDGVGFVSSVVGGAQAGALLIKGRYGGLVGGALGALAHLQGHSEAQKQAYDDAVLEGRLYTPEGAQAIFDDIEARIGDDLAQGELTEAQLAEFRPELEQLAQSIDRLMRMSSDPDNLARIDPIAVQQLWAEAARTSHNLALRAFAQQITTGTNDFARPTALEPDRLSSRAYVPDDAVTGLNFTPHTTSDIFSFVDEALDDDGFLASVPDAERERVLRSLTAAISQEHQDSVWSDAPYGMSRSDASHFPRSEEEIRDGLRLMRAVSPQNYEAAIGRLADLLHPYQIDLDLPDLRREIDARNAAVPLA